MDIIAVPTIAAVVYFIITIYKMIIGKTNQKLMQIIPIIAAISGAILAVIAYYFVPGVLIAANVFLAILIGGVSGLSATGIHQVFKQFTRTDDTQISEEDEKDGANDESGKK